MSLIITLLLLGSQTELNLSPKSKLLEVWALPAWKEALGQTQSQLGFPFSLQLLLLHLLSAEWVLGPRFTAPGLNNLSAELGQRWGRQDSESLLACLCSPPANSSNG